MFFSEFFFSDPWTCQIPDTLVLFFERKIKVLVLFMFGAFFSCYLLVLFALFFFMVLGSLTWVLCTKLC